MVRSQYKNPTKGRGRQSGLMTMSLSGLEDALLRLRYWHSTESHMERAGQQCNDLTTTPCHVIDELLMIYLLSFMYCSSVQNFTVIEFIKVFAKMVFKMQLIQNNKKSSQNVSAIIDFCSILTILLKQFMFIKKEKKEYFLKI